MMKMVGRRTFASRTIRVEQFSLFRYGEGEMHNLCLIVCCLLNFIQLDVFGQSSNDDLFIENHKFPNLTISNLCEFVNMRSLEWESAMKKYEFNNRYLDGGCTYYDTDILLKSGKLAYSKCPGYKISVLWKSSPSNSHTILDDLVNELEPYYYGLDENGNAEYAFRKNDFNFIFVIHRSNGFEFFWLYRFEAKD